MKLETILKRTFVVCASSLLLSGCITGHKASRSVGLISTNGLRLAVNANDQIIELSEDEKPPVGVSPLVTGYNDEGEDLDEPQTGAVYKRIIAENNVREADIEKYQGDPTLDVGGRFIKNAGNGISQVTFAAKWEQKKPDVNNTKIITTSQGGAGGTGGAVQGSGNSTNQNIALSKAQAAALAQAKAQAAALAQAKAQAAAKSKPQVQVNNCLTCG